MRLVFETFCPCMTGGAENCIGSYTLLSTPDDGVRACLSVSDLGSGALVISAGGGGIPRL